MATLSLPDGLTHIGDYAFYYYSGFTGSLTIPNSVSSIGRSAFEGCSGFTGSLTIPNSVKSIGSGAFNGCSKLAGSLTIPDSITTISNGTFYGCSGFTGSLTIPNSVTSIGNEAFYNCSGFTGTLTIPSSVTSIGLGAFRGCGGTGFSVDEENMNFKSDSGMLLSKNGTTLIACPTGKTGTITIPDSVTTIGDSAFMGCGGTEFSVDEDNTYFKSVDGMLLSKNGTTLIACPTGKTGTLTIPSSVTTISNYAFYNCSGFTGKLTIPDGVKTIGYGAFEGCSGFTSITIPDSVTNIGGNAFGNIFFYDDDGTRLECTAEKLRGHTFTIPHNHMVEGDPPKYTITVVASPSAGGTVTGGGTYDSESTATITATANSGYQFSRWSDNNTNAKRTVTVNSDITYTAIFEHLPVCKITSSAVNGTITKTQNVNRGSDFTVSYNADDGYLLKYIIVDGTEINIANHQNSYTFHNVTESHSISVIYGTEEKYSVQFIDWDGKIISSAQYSKNESIVIPESPSRDSDEYYSYKFLKWNPSVPEKCVSDAFYIAQYDRTAIGNDNTLIIALIIGIIALAAVVAVAVLIVHKK